MVIITTKRGKSGAMNINLKATWGVSSRAFPVYERVNSAEYMELAYEALKNSYIYASGMSEADAIQQTQASFMKELGGELVVLDPSPETMTNLSLAGMERLLRIETNGDTAVSATAASATGEAGDARTANDGAKPMSAPMAPPKASQKARKASALGADGGRKSPGRPGGRTSRKDPKGTRRTSLLKKEPSA